MDEVQKPNKPDYIAAETKQIDYAEFVYLCVNFNIEKLIADVTLCSILQ